MKISITSDIHIKEKGDEGYQYLFSFLKSPKIQNSDKVILLGDIFDLMVGNRIEYITEFEEIFQLLKKLCEKGVEVYFFEGNHDFHIDRIFKEYFSEFSNKFKFIKDDKVIINIGKTRMRLSHGDDLEVDNLSYQRYKKVIRSQFIKLLADKVVPYRFVRAIGVKASKKSRKRNNKYFNQEDKIKEKFRNYALKVQEEENIDVLICGHSHVQDFFITDNFKYINNGYAQKTNSFIYINNQNIEFISLQES
ncbi:UDP-2,3-diacylglucosamine diphosphatase [Bacteriovoracaceae bacterium]|nr:UDP-2,3-diacylglucosamine diphosphatase [Bacteriovoracaceae bacterium]